MAKVAFSSPELAFPEIEQVLQQLQEMQEDELLLIQDQHIQILEKGKPFVRSFTRTDVGQLFRALSKPSKITWKKQDQEKILQKFSCGKKVFCSKK